MPARNEKIARRLWQKFLEFYGRQWEVSYGHVDGDVFPTWRDALSEFTPDQIHRGLNRLLSEGNEYPPNLIKFLRMCRTVEPYSNHNKAPALPRPTPRYSVMRIEQAKQVALLGESFKAARIPDKAIMDWTGEDEVDLLDLIKKWDPATDLPGLNELIDNHQFSHGSQHANLHKAG